MAQRRPKPATDYAEMICVICGWLCSWTEMFFSVCALSIEARPDHPGEFVMLKLIAAGALTLLILVIPAQAWNNKGHMLVAYIAYTNLDPAVRQKVDALLERHPDFARLQQNAGSPNSQNYHLIIFMNAATWPDSIRKDGRFYDETDSDETPTPLLDGYPSMKRFTGWHYIDLPFPINNAQVTQPGSVNAFRLLKASTGAINNPKVRASSQAYFLSWCLHVAGDVRQPLHCISRFTPE